MKQIKYYIAGLATIMVVIPIINSLLEVVDLWIETLKIRPTKKVLEGNSALTILREFTKPAEEIYDYEVEYYDDED